MIKQIGLPLRGRPILLITRMITDRIGLHSVLLPLQIFVAPTSQGTVKSNKNVQLVLQHCRKTSSIAKLPVLTTMLKPVKLLHVG